MKVSKVLSLLLTLALIVIGTVAITASAEESPTIEITSQNLSYESNISILFAVKTANTDVAPKLNVYTADPTEATLTPKTVEATFTPENSLEKVGYADGYIFFTPGIAAKALDTEIYVQAVVTVNEVEYKSNVVRYSVVEYCHEMNAKKNTTDYNDIINYGTRVQKMLESDGKFSGAYASDYKYVTIEGGTLDGKYDAGIYLENETVTPYAEGVTSWQATDGTIVSNGKTYTIGTSNVAFTKSTVRVYKTGTYDFENCPENSKPGTSLGWPSGLGVDSGYAYQCIEDTVYGQTSKVYKVTPSVANKLLTFYTTYNEIAADEATGFEFSFDFRFEEGKNATYDILVDQSAGCAFLLHFRPTDNGTGIYIWNDKNKDEKATIFEGLVPGYNHMTLKVVEKDGQIVCELYQNGTYKTEFVTQNVAATELTSFSRVRIRSNNSGLYPLYFDNVYCGFIKE